MNKDTDKTKEQLLAELAELRKQSKEQENKLKAANQQLAANNIKIRKNLEYALENMSDGFVSLDENWHYINVNKKAGAMFGRKPEDLVGKHIWTEFPEGIGHPFYKNYYKAVKTQKAIYFEDYYQPWDRWFENRVFPTQKGLSIFFYDITERKLAKEKLKETNQQLNASNQQLLATEQQLRANNQQLIANEKALKESESKLNVAQKLAKIGDFSWNVVTDEVTWSDGMYKLLKYDKDEKLDFAKVNSKIYHPDDLDRITKWLNDSLASGKDKLEPNEYRIIRKDGKVIFVYTEGKITYENGKAISVFGICQDITDRKRAEEKLRESEAFRSRIFDSSHLPIVVMEADTFYYIDCNPAAIEIYGYTSKEQVLGLTPMDVSAPFQYNDSASSEKALFYIDKAKTEGSVVFEWKHQRPNGIVWDAEVHLLSFSVGERALIQFTLVDITERKKAEFKLQVSEKSFSDVVDNLMDGVAIADENAYNIYVNPRFSKITGYSNDELLNLTIWDFTRPEDRAEIKQKIQDQLAGRPIPKHYDKIIVRKDGTEVPVEMSTTTTIWKNKKCPMAIIHDITERKQADEKLLESETKFRRLAETTSAAILIYQNDYFIYANPAAEIITGYRFDELKQMKFWTIVSPEFVDLVKERGQVRQRGEPVPSGYEFKIITKQGKEKWVFLTGNNLELNNEKAGLITAIDITKRKQAEKELIKLSTAIKQSPSIIIITDIEGKIEYVNPKFTNITGYSLEEIIGQNPRILKSRKHSDEMYKELWETISSGKTWRGEFHNKKKNGELFWEMAFISPIFDVEGKIINFLKVSEDITEQKRNEQIQNIIHNISNAVISSHSLGEFLALVKDELGKLIDTTNFFVALYNEDSDRISLPLHYEEKNKMGDFPVGKTLTNYVIKSGKPLLATKALIQKLINSGEVEQVGHISEVWLGAPLKIHNKITGILAVQSYDNENAFDEADVKMLEIISHQISLSLERLKTDEDLKLAKEKAEESEYKVRSMFENTQIGILYCNAEGEILEANQVMLDILGSPSMDATLKINLLTFKPLQENGFANNVEKCISEKTIITDDTVYTSKWGKSVFMKYYLVPVILNNNVIGVWANLNNLTDLWNAQNQLKKAKEKAEESDRLKSAFLANMSHEIRTPMNAILGFTELLKEPQLTGDEKDKYIQIIEKSGNRLLNTINDIIDISRIEAGEVKLKKTKVSVNDIIKEQYNLFYHEAELKGIELKYELSLSDKEAHFITDKNKLEGILTNLIKNAIKFTETGSIIFGYNINTLQDKEYFEFYVKDTGIGIPEDRIDAVFNRFEQADIEDSKVFEGSGLGLAIAKSHIEMFGGKIIVKSKVGEGSTFTFSIPYNDQN